MRTIKAVIALVLMLLLANVVVGADPKKPAAPPLTWETTMPAIEISKQPLEKVLNDLKKKLPGFDFSISRENVPHDYPVLPAMSVENVSLEDFFNLVQQEVPGVNVAYGPIDSFNRPIRGDGHPPLCIVSITPDTSGGPQTVRVFGLAELIAYRSTGIQGVEKREDRDKQATNEILSMIQAALDVAGDNNQPVMKLHPETKTLIFKGTDAQAQIVESAIKALHTGDGTAINLLREENTKLGAQLQKVLARERDLNTQNLEMYQKLNHPSTLPSK
jgi:hypothetical protein